MTSDSLDASGPAVESRDSGELNAAAFAEIKQIEKSLKDIYFISGLGADERVFKMLQFEGYRPVHLRWLEPLRGEAIADYARRLSAQITTDEPVIIGLSFGGMVAIEIAKQIPVSKVILLSSVKTQAEVPLYYRLFRWLPLHRIFPFKQILWAIYWFAYWLFDVKALSDRELLRAILLDTDPHFLKWALHQVVIWQNQTVPDHLVQIHGRSDRIFPARFVQPTTLLEQAGHLMVINRAAELSKLLEQAIG